jgi:pimeloyl-ACP methyl ester carboxylesterase
MSMTMKLRGAKAVAGLAGAVALGSAVHASRGFQESAAPREWYREGTGRTVVMLGGGVYGAAMFAPHARDLSGDFDVIRVQTLNVQTAESGTSMPSDYSVAAEVSALHQTLSFIGVTGEVDLVGSSLGAVVALHFSTTYPEQVRTLTLFEPPAFWVLPDEEYQRDPVVREMRDLTSAMTPWAAPSDEQLFRFRCLLGACPPEIPDRADAGRAEWDVSRLAMRGLAAVPAHREDRGDLARLEAPVLLLTGSETVPFHRRMNDLLARELPRVERAELPGGHSASRTARSAFNEQLRSFLARHE